VLYGSRYWGGLLDWIRDTLAVEGMVSDSDLALVQVVDTTDEVCAIATGGAPR
jgi:predicted Rossmann-fold nucleotide-binding protein